MKARFLWRAYKTRYRDQVVEIAAIRDRLHRGDLACDVGANKGSYLYWMSRWAGRVVAFEPQPGLAAYLETACRALNLTNVTVEPAAVSATNGSLNLYIPSPNSPGASLIPIAGAMTLPVRVVALDDYFKPSDSVAVLKVDVEGAELDVFKGAERILRENRPLLVFECEQRHLTQGTVGDCLRYLEGLGYRGHLVCRKTAIEASRFDPAVHQKESGDAFWNSKDYCNNFVFKPRAGA